MAPNTNGVPSYSLVPVSKHTVWNWNGYAGTNKNNPATGEPMVDGPQFTESMVMEELPTTGNIAPVCNQKYIDTYKNDPLMLFIPNCTGMPDWFQDIPYKEVPCFNSAATWFNPATGRTEAVPCHSGNIRVDSQITLKYNKTLKMHEFREEDNFPLTGCGFNDQIGRSWWATGYQNSKSPWPKTEYFNNTYLFTSELYLSIMCTWRPCPLPAARLDGLHLTPACADTRCARWLDGCGSHFVRLPILL